MLGMHAWRGDEQVLDVGCGRGLLLAGAAKRLQTLAGDGRATGIDVWSNVDMGGNSESATRRNLELEGISARCTLVSEPAQTMGFPDASFDLIVSNLCLHNIYDRPSRMAALRQIVRVLKPDGEALISDYKHTAEYATEFRKHGFAVERRWGSWVYDLSATARCGCSQAAQCGVGDYELSAASKVCRGENAMAGKKEIDLRDELETQLLALLAGGQAHADFDKVVAGMPEEMRGARPERVPYSAWQLLEHLRITQRDILEFCTNRDGAGYKKLAWPAEVLAKVAGACWCASVGGISCRSPSGSRAV